jgi:purine-binding chemotaxis protein CheW
MADQPALRLVLFRLGSHNCGTAATGVREVIPADRPTRIPGTDDVIAGLLNLRGVLLTVVDGRRLLGVQDPDPRPESVLVLDQNGHSVGLAVDEVLDLIEIEAADLVAGERLPGLDPGLVHAVGRHEGRVFALLDLAPLVAPLMGQ